MKIKDVIKDVAQEAASWPDKYQPGARRVMNEILSRVEPKNGGEKKRFLTTVEYAEQIGSTAYQVRQFCEIGKIPGAFRTSKSGWWMIDTWAEDAAEKN